jgi:hypothetical protein
MSITLWSTDFDYANEFSLKPQELWNSCIKNEICFRQLSFETSRLDEYLASFVQNSRKNGGPSCYVTSIIRF